MRFIVSAPSVNCAILFALNVALLELNHESLLDLNIDNTQDIFHVFFVHGKEGFSGDFLRLEDLDVIFITFLIRPFDQVFGIPFFCEFPAFFDGEEVFGAVDDPADFFVFQTFQEFGFFGVFNVQFKNFGLFNIISGISGNAEVIDLKMLGLVFVFFIQNLSAFELFEVNGKKFVFVESVLSNCEEMRLGLLYCDDLGFKINVAIFLDFSCFCD